MNYLIDEASDTGKGANTIVSLLHHYFQEHGLGETDVHLHADNCVGRKTRIMPSSTTSSGTYWSGYTEVSPSPS